MQQYIETEEFLTEAEAAQIIKNVISGVRHLHESNIIHMDLKPENILFMSETGANIKLIDFHLA